jgi:phage protein U
MSVLMAWGPYRFEAGASAYEELRHRVSARWAKHEIIGRQPVGQYLGPENETVSLRGTVYPLDAAAGASSMPRAMADECKAGNVYTLLAGDGEVFGPYRLEKCERTDSEIVGYGKPLKINYDMEFVAHVDPEGQIWSLWP